MKEAMKVACSIALWYSVSITLTALNKVLFSTLNVQFPILITFTHFAFVSLLLRMGVACSNSFYGLPTIQWGAFLKTILPIGFLTAVDIALTNIAYRMVSIAVITVMKSAICAVTYVICVAFGLEQFNLSLLAVVVGIIGSISLTVPAMEIESNWGIVVLVIAVISGALRWVIVHSQLHHTHLSYGAVQLSLLTQPVATVFIAFPAVLIDVPKIGASDTTDVQKATLALILIGVSVIFALSLIVTEYYIVRITSSLTLTVAGVGKEIFTILMSMIVFKEVIEFLPAVGIGLSIACIIIYTYLRRSAEAHGEHECVEDIVPNNGKDVTPLSETGYGGGDSPVSASQWSPDRTQPQIVSVQRSQSSEWSEVGSVTSVTELDGID
eukprot:GHVN01017985.1.p1 GENE.GHVN01017985.1~~GHVN01017985.1.p1  ORF type:complete len:382 (+),score=44.04 GHVN01017985.1:254-1399(+)